MRKHLTALLATLAAAFTIGGTAFAASAASASTARPAVTGTTITTTSQAGYEASGRDFRFATALLRVPDWIGTFAYPQTYIQLSNGSLNEAGDPTGDQYVRAGIETCAVAKFVFGDTTCVPGGWVTYVEAFNNSLNTPYFEHYFNLSGVAQGDGVDFSVYFDQAGNELHFTVTPPSTSGPEQFYKTQAYGPVFDHAAALDDFTDSTGVPIPLPPFVQPFQINQIEWGALTTYSGARGSFTGPWTTSPVYATSNGLADPLGTNRVTPSGLGSDGHEVNGAVRSGDEFTLSAVG